jgi:hypothetical protein
MPLSLKIADSLIIIPDLQPSILSSRNKVLSFMSNIQGIEFTIRALDRTDNLPIEFLPISNLSIRSSSKNLVLFGVENSLFEGSRLEQAEKPCSTLKIPYNARSITASTHGLRIVLTYLDTPDSASMLLHRSLHDLSLLADSPDTNFTLSTSRNNSFSVSCCCY